jgi:transcriptional regulator with XRE-family HTH domain
MILELIRKEIKRCRQSRNKICEAAGVEPAALSRFMNGGSLKAESCDKLLALFGYELRKKCKRKR